MLLIQASCFVIPLICSFNSCNVYSRFQLLLLMLVCFVTHKVIISGVILANRLAANIAVVAILTKPHTWRFSDVTETRPCQSAAVNNKCNDLSHRLANCVKVP